MQYCADQEAFASGQCCDEPGFTPCSEAKPSEGSVHTAPDEHQQVLYMCILMLRLLDVKHCTCEVAETLSLHMKTGEAAVPQGWQQSYPTPPLCRLQMEGLLSHGLPPAPRGLQH